MHPLPIAGEVQRESGTLFLFPHIYNHLKYFKMKTKTIPMPLPAEDAGGQPVQVAQRSPGYVQETVFEAFGELFSQTDSVKCIMVKTNGVLNLQFIGNGCVASLQIYEVRSNNALEPYIPKKPVRRRINSKKGVMA